jgi:hypothetical protein
LPIGQSDLEVHTHTALQLARYRLNDFALLVSNLQLTRTLGSVVSGMFHRQAPSPAHQEHENGNANHNGKPNSQIQMFSNRCKPRHGAASLLLFGKNIADAAHCQDSFRHFVIVFNGHSNAAHVDIDGPIESFQFSAPDSFHDLIAREDAASPFCNGHQQIKLIGR